MGIEIRKLDDQEIREFNNKKIQNLSSFLLKMKENKMPL